MAKIKQKAITSIFIIFTLPFSLFIYDPQLAKCGENMAQQMIAAMQTATTANTACSLMI